GGDEQKQQSDQRCGRASHGVVLLRSLASGASGPTVRKTSCPGPVPRGRTSECGATLPATPAGVKRASTEGVDKACLARVKRRAASARSPPPLPEPPVSDKQPSSKHTFPIQRKDISALRPQRLRKDTGSRLIG